VDWDAEKPCFETFARETADFYAVKAKWLSLPTEDEPPQQVQYQYSVAVTNLATARITVVLDFSIVFAR